MASAPVYPERSPFRRSFYFWTWLAIFFSAGVCSTLGWLRYEQSEIMAEANQVIDSISHARIDFSKGFLHVTLAGDPHSPFRKEEGMALMDQAIASWEEARSQGIAGQRLVMEEGHSWDAFEEAVTAFRADLAGWMSAQGETRVALEPLMRIKFHKLEEYASQLDLASQAKLKNLNRQLNRTFAIAILISACLLFGICIGIYRAGRNQMQTVLALRGREEQLRELGNNLPDGYIYQYIRMPDGSSVFTHISDGVERVHGVSVADCLRDATCLTSLIDPAQREDFAKAVARSAENLSDFSMDLCFRDAEGELRTVYVRSKPRIDGQGRVVWDGLVLDITKQKDAEEAIRRQQRNYEVIFNASNDALFLHDAETGRILDVNDAMVRMYCFNSKSAALACEEQPLLRNPSPYDHAEAIRRIHRVKLEGPQVFEWQTRRKNGERFWVEVSLSRALMDGQDRVLAVVRDISQRKEHEVEIERLARLYSTLSQVNQVIVRCQTRAELFDEICRVMVEFGKMRAVWIGMIREDAGRLEGVARRTADNTDLQPIPTGAAGCGVIGDAIRTMAPALCNDLSSDSRARNCREVAAGADVRSCAAFPLHFRRQFAGVFSICSTETNFFNADEVRLLEEIAEDISFALDRLDEQSQRREAEADRFRLITAVEQAVESIIITDLQGSIVYVNPAFEAITGYSKIEVIGRNPRILKSERHNAEFYSAMWHMLSGGEIWRGRITNRKKDGSIYDEDGTISPMRDSSGRIVNYIAVRRDITREVELESQIRQAQKLEGIGQLAGGVAHDFNNILTAIMMQAQLAECTAGVPGKVVEDMVQIRQSCERGANLTRQLLLFSRKQKIQPCNLDLNDTVTNITKMLQRVIGENISIRLNLHSRPLITHADAGMLDQVLLNLSVNGRDAMSGDGRLTIETSEKSIDEKTALLHPDAEPGKYVCLSVGDTGCGIPPEALPRIFEPFFTTKEQGKGTGLGLATVFGIVKQHKGWIDIRTELGRGTRFDIYLPAIQTPLSPAADEVDVSRLFRGTETILLAEDDVSIRRLTRIFLEMHGYTVLEASNGVEALAIWQQHSAGIDLLLTDLLMPGGINGRDLAGRLMERIPDLKIVYFSGYSADLVGRGLELRLGENFLQKPVMPNQLLELVRRRLDA